MSANVSDSNIGERTARNTEVDGFNEQWLQSLSWQVLVVDGEIARYRVHSSLCSRKWLIAKSASLAADSVVRRIEREFDLRGALEPAWAVIPVALVPMPEGPLLILEDLGGQPLHDFADGTLSIGRFLRLAVGAAQALGHAHEHGILHRDIKPCNLIESSDGVVRLTGFGVSVLHDSDTQLPVADSICGTLAYMSPEQARRVERQADERSDLYSLGMALYELLTGQLPFEASDPVEWVYSHVARQPPSPTQMRESVPQPLGHLILKLIAKNPADRYQSASGLEADLRLCLAQWNEFQHIAFFEPAMHETNGASIAAPELIARSCEIEALRACFERVTHNGLCEIVLLSGYAGSGKSALVRRLHQDLALTPVLFASGKFDQYQKDIPYASLAQALRSLVMRILGESTQELDRWRDKLADALGGHGRLIANLVPEIEWVTGPLPDILDLPATEAQGLFNFVLQRLIGTFATAEHPLILFFDDLQWLDDATLSFFTHFSAAGYRHLMLVGAYRDNEVSDSTVFSTFLRRLRSGTTRLTELEVTPLNLDAVSRLIAQMLSSDPASLEPLAQAVYEQTAGNPFFIDQLLRSLFDEQLIRRDGESRVWTWDSKGILEHRYADNVIDLMVARIARLPEKTRTVLGHLACIGLRANEGVLACVNQSSIKTVRRHLGPAVEAGLVVENRGGFVFCHDRIQEAAYSLTPKANRPAEHARIARLMLKELSNNKLSNNSQQDTTFQIVTHIQRALPSEVRRAEKCRFIHVLLKAARRSKKAAAVQSALNYLATAQALAGDRRWSEHYTISYEVELLQAQCWLLDGQFEPASRAIAVLLEHVRSGVEKAAVYMLKVELLALSSSYQAAVETAIEGLKTFAINIPLKIGDVDIEQALSRLQQTLGARSIASLVDLPEMQSVEIESAMGLLSSMTGPVSFIDEKLLFLHLCHMVQLSLEHGVTSSSAHGFAWFGIVLAHMYGRYEDGFEFAHTARKIVEHRGYVGGITATLVALDQVSAWTQPLTYSLGCARAAFDASCTEGNLTMSCYACNHIVSDMLVMGEHLDRVQDQIERGLSFTRQVNFHDVEAILQTQASFIKSMRCTDHQRALQAYSDPAIEAQVFESAMTPMVFWWWLLKGMSSFFYGDLVTASACLNRADTLKWSTPAHIQLLDFHLFSALNLAARCTSTQDIDLTVALIEPHLRKLNGWATLTPSTFNDKALLVQAEVARLKDDTLLALSLYEEAVRAAAAQGFIHMQALAHELAGRCYEANGLHTAARSHARGARDCYQRWGAEGKVQQLEMLHAFLREQPSTSRSSINIVGVQDKLDLVSVMKASQALSEEIVLDRLIETLVTQTIVHAGAQRGLLILVKGGVPLIEASGRVKDVDIEVDLTERVPHPSDLALSMVFTVMHTRQLIALDDARGNTQFCVDPYFMTQQVRSVLCLPLVKQGQVIGVLYLENNLAPGVFTANRTTVLELLAAQAAISLETARLYAELLEENAKRREIESALRTSKAVLALGQRMSHSGSFRWNAMIDEAFWSDELFAVWGFPLAEAPPRERDLGQYIHPDDREGFKSMLEHAVRTRTPFQHEFRVNTPDGKVKHLEVLGAPDGENIFVGVASDVTERRATEAALRNARAELARVTQATTMGELAASIAHEINQPLASIVSNASASVRWLTRQAPDVAEALGGLREIVNDGRRAGDIVRALQALAKQSAPNMRRLEIDDVIKNVLTLTASEIEQKHVVLTVKLAASEKPVMGDRVQLQQVILNLVMNAVEAMSSIDSRQRILSVTSRMRYPDHVIVSVEDTGHGIQAHDIEHVFDAFFTTKDSGMGMGLAICRSIIAAHKGNLYVVAGHSTGSRFEFTLPTADVAGYTE